VEIRSNYDFIFDFGFMLAIKAILMSAFFRKILFLTVQVLKDFIPSKKLDQISLIILKR